MLVEIPAFFIYFMPKSRNRKKKNPLVQIIKEPQFIIKDYKGQTMRVPNPKYGRSKTIIHSIQQPPKDKGYPQNGG